MTTVTINGERKEIDNGVVLSELIKGLDLPDSRIAVELNRCVIRKSEWNKTIVSDADIIEIVHFVGGG